MPKRMMPKRIAAMSFSVTQKKHKGDWYRIENSAGISQVHVYDDIGTGGITAKNFLGDMAKIKGPLEIHLNSGGGEVFDGLAIYSALKQRGNVAIVVDSLAASIASVIAMSADEGKLSIARNATMMIHDGFGMTVGNAADMRQMADLLDRTSDNIASIYSDRTGRPASEFRDMMRGEKWFSAQEAVDEGLADQVISVSNSLRNDSSGWIQRDGKLVFDPENDGDDDYQASTDTDHDYWDADGNQLKPIPASPDGKHPAKPLKKKNRQGKKFFNAKYSDDDRKRMAGKEAMPDGSYPIADEEDLGNAIRAVGRGSGDHDAIRRHIIKRAKALGASGQIPDNWGADGSLNDGWNPSVISGYFTQKRSI